MYIYKQGKAAPSLSGGIIGKHIIPFRIGVK
jgi:hypothetical protein